MVLAAIPKVRKGGFISEMRPIRSLFKKRLIDFLYLVTFFVYY